MYLYKMYLSECEIVFFENKLTGCKWRTLAAISIVFVKNSFCICPKFKMHLYNCEMYLFEIWNVFFKSVENKYGWPGASGGPCRLSLLCQTNVKSIAGKTRKTSKYWKKKEIEDIFCQFLLPMLNLFQ